MAILRPTRPRGAELVKIKAIGNSIWEKYLKKKFTFSSNSGLVLKYG